MAELRPCPFCGAQVKTPWKSQLMGGYIVECDECHTIVSPQAENETDAIAAWNRRDPAAIVLDPENAKRRAAIYEALDTHEIFPMQAAVRAVLTALRDLK